MIYMIFIKSIVIRNPICKFNINRRISCFHQFQIYKQPPCTTIPIYKWMNAFKFNMEPSKPGNDMLSAVSISFQQLLHLRLDQIRLYRFMFCPHNSYWNSSVNPAVLFFIRQYQIMDLLYHAF